MTCLLVEVSDFVDAAGSTYREVADPTDVASGRSASVLLGVGVARRRAMAGDDPGGQGWARVYDRAAESALRAAQQTVNAAYETSSMFGRSGLNYAEADVWPDGHQDRLLRAARAWTAAAAAVFDEASSWSAIAALGFARDALPEADDMCTVCRGLSGHLAELAAAFRSLATACTELPTTSMSVTRPSPTSSRA